MSKNIEVSIVSPMHNEEACINEFVSRTTAVLNEQFPAYELVLVNDGSTDKTESLLQDAADKNSRIKLVNLARNSGQWAATYAGIQHSEGDFVVVMDSDLQHLPEEVPSLINKMKEGYELVSGVRQKRRDSLIFRRFPSMVANWLLRRITQCPSKDMGGFKCIEGTLARSLQIRAGQHRFLPALIWLRGGRVGDVPISSPPRFAGKSHYGLSRTFDVLFDIILFWLQHSFKARPIYSFGHMSFTLGLFSVAIFAWVAYEKFWLGIDMGTRPPFFLSLAGITLSFGLLFIGFILELLSSVQNAISDYRPYFVRSVYQGSESEQKPTAVTAGK